MKVWRAVVRWDQSERELFYKGEKIEGIIDFGVRAGISTRPVLQIAIDGRELEVDWGVDYQTKEGGGEPGS